MFRTVSVIYIGGIPNLINAVFIKLQSHSRIKHQEAPRLQRSNKQSQPVMATRLLYGHIGELCDWAYFGIIDDFIVNQLLRTSFINRYMQAMFPGDQKLVSQHSPSVAIIKSHNKPVWTSRESEEQQISVLRNHPSPVIFCKGVVIAPHI